jgi:succinate dehydrogenase / fumarate reductase cytochrome b subunit
VEWAFIFLPILFHAILGVIIIRGGLPNHSSYPLAGNVRYTLQRVTGMIAFLFILWHVGHMHGWFHFEAWVERIAGLGGAQFRPYNAASSLGLAMQSWVVGVLYAIGILSCIFHLANGIWTMGITWGVWVSPIAQQRANYVCSAFGVGLAVVGMAALYGSMTVPVDQALESEQRMYDARIAAEVPASEAAELKEEHKHHRKLWSDKELEDNFSEEEPEISSETDTEPASANVKPGTAGLK